ncbi:MAG: hypothetical protein R2708_14480 [Vicinamibacterales bacterium]
MKARRLGALALIAIAVSPLGARQTPPSASSGDGLVLATERTIEFTTDEVTWMSVDVSPDGQTIVFDLLGDLYTLPIAGGEARRIVGGMSFESQPTWSPDGRRSRSSPDRTGVENLWIADADGGNPRAVSKDGRTNDRPQIMASPAWTPDGQYIVVSKARPPDPGTFWLYMYHRDGGAGVRVGAPPPPQRAPDAAGPPPPPPPNRLGAVVSPDGRFVYYAQRTGSFTYNARFPLWQVYRHDRETGEAAQVTNAQGSAMRPVLSPDGTWLVFATRHKTDTGLRIRNLETGAERWLAYPVTRDDQESRASRDTMPRYDFMPDGRSIVVPVAGKLQRIDVATGAATPIPFTARVQAEVAARAYSTIRIEDGPTVRARLVRWPRVSPDGRRLAFSALNHLYVMDLPSGTPRRVTTNDEGEFMPAWAPDGQSIVYVTWTSTGGHIKRVAAAGGTPTTLTAYEGYYLDPVFTAGGTRLAFLAGAAADQLYAILLDTPPPDADGPDAPAEIGGINPPNTLEIRTMPAAGGAQTYVAAAQGGRGLHVTARDPERVFFTTNRGLVSVTLTGYDRRTHLRVTGIGPGNSPPSADEIRLSPDGARAFVNLQGRHYLFAVPRAGRETVEVRIQRREDGAPVPVKAMSALGGDYLDWTSDSASVTWALGAQVFRQGVDAADPQRTDVVVEAPRARATGSVLLTGARVITMNGDEVIERGDVLVTDNRIAAVGPRGRVAAPAGVRRIDLRGKTVMPGLVDVHAHMWAPRGLHQTAVWQYYANLAYGVTTTRDPQTSTPDVFAYADMVDAGMIAGAARVRHRARRLLVVGHRQPRVGRQLHPPLQGGLPHQHAEAVRGGRPSRAAVDHPGLPGTGHHAHHRGLARPEAEPDADRRRLHRSGAQLPDHAPAPGRRGVRGPHEDLLHADDPRGLRRAVERELLLRDREHRRRREAQQVDPQRAARHHDPATRAVVHPRGVRPHEARHPGGRHRPRRRPRRPRQPRPAAGPGRPLGDLEPGLGGTHTARDAEGHHHLRRRGPRHAAGRRLDRAREVRGPGGARRQPTGQPAQHQHRALRDEERRALRRRHAQHDLAGGEDAGQAVLVGHGAAAEIAWSASLAFTASRRRARRAAPPGHKYGNLRFVRTTIDIPDATYRRLKAKAASDGRSVKSLLLDAAEQALAGAPAARPRRVALPLITTRRPGSLRLDNERIYDVIAFP